MYTATFSKDSFSIMFAYFTGVRRVAHGRHRMENFLSLGRPFAGKGIFLGFFLESESFLRIMGSFEEKLTRKIHATFLYFPFLL